MVSGWRMSPAWHSWFQMPESSRTEITPASLSTVWVICDQFFCKHWLLIILSTNPDIPVKVGKGLGASVSVLVTTKPAFVKMLTSNSGAPIDRKKVSAYWLEGKRVSITPRSSSPALSSVHRCALLVGWRITRTFWTQQSIRSSNA